MPQAVLQIVVNDSKIKYLSHKHLAITTTFERVRSNSSRIAEKTVSTVCSVVIFATRDEYFTINCLYQIRTSGVGSKYGIRNILVHCTDTPNISGSLLDAFI